MDKVKIQEIADEAGLSNGDLLEKAKELGFDVKAANSTINMEDAGILVDYAISGTLPKGFNKPGSKTKIKVVKKKVEPVAEETVTEEVVETVPVEETVEEVAEISQHAGGIGIHMHNIRSKGSYIKGTGGVSNGLVPMLKVYNETANYVDQGGGKRKGSFAIYLEPWHADIFEFLDLKKNTGKEEFRARDLFYAM